MRQRHGARPAGVSSLRQIAVGLNQRGIPTARGGAWSAVQVERVADLRPIIADVQASGATSLRQIAVRLNARGIPTAWGGAWSAVQVKRVLERA